MRADILERVMDQISQNPHTLGIYQWCGWAQCIGGWVMAYAGYPINYRRSISQQVADVLQIQLAQAKRLCHVCYWPEPFRTDFYVAGNDKEEAHVTLARLRHFIDTLGCDDGPPSGEA